MTEFEFHYLCILGLCAGCFWLGARYGERRADERFVRVAKERMKAVLRRMAS